MENFILSVFRKFFKLYQVVLHCIDKYQCEAVVIDFGRDSHRQGDFHNERQLVLDQARVPVFVV